MMDMLGNISPASPNASDLIQDLLVAHREMLPVRSLCRAGTLLGLSESAVRVALTRLVSQGKIIHCARGCYALNLSGAALARTVDDWEHGDQHVVPWNGCWLGVHDATVLRSDKVAWRRHGLALSLSGFRLLQSGLHLRPDNLAGSVTAVRKQLLGLGLAPQSAVFRVDELDDARQAKALGLWEVDKLSIRYRQMRNALQTSTRNLKSVALESAVRESLLLGRAVIGQIIRDPLLPSEMGPSKDRQAVMKEMRVYQGKARSLWRKWLALARTDP